MLSRPSTRTAHIFTFALGTLASACGSAPTALHTVEDAHVQRAGAGVRLAEASRRFIEVQEVTQSASASVLRAPARVAFRDGAVARLRASLPCRVERVHVRTGDRVKADDALVSLSCPEAASSRSSLVAARAAVHEAEAAAERQRKMLAQGVSTERELLQAERTLVDAQAALARAEAAVRFVGRGDGGDVVLRAPFAGTVVSRAATVGATVEPGGEPLVEVGDASQLWVVAEVFERDLHAVAEGASVRVEVASLGGTLTGRVDSIGAVVSGARTAQVRIALEESAGVVRPGMFARVQIDSAGEHLTVPTSAIVIKDGRKSLVYEEVEPGRYEPRVVTTSQPIDGMVVITSGIAAGARVVVRGALLIDGASEQLL